MSELSPKPFQMSEKLQRAMRLGLMIAGIAWWGIWTNEARSTSKDAAATKDGTLSSVLLVKSLAEATLGCGVCAFASGLAGNEDRKK